MTTTSCKTNGDTSRSWGVITLPLISPNAAPSLPPSLPYQCCKLQQSTLKGGEGKGSGKGLNSRYGGYWKLEKLLFNESVSTILQVDCHWIAMLSLWSLVREGVYILCLIWCFEKKGFTPRAVPKNNINLVH